MKTVQQLSFRVYYFSYSIDTIISSILHKNFKRQMAIFPFYLQMEMQMEMNSLG